MSIFHFGKNKRVKNEKDGERGIFRSGEKLPWIKIAWNTYNGVVWINI